MIGDNDGSIRPRVRKHGTDYEGELAAVGAGLARNPEGLPPNADRPAVRAMVEAAVRTYLNPERRYPWSNFGEASTNTSVVGAWRNSVVWSNSSQGCRSIMKPNFGGAGQTACQI